MSIRLWFFTIAALSTLAGAPQAMSSPIDEDREFAREKCIENCG